MIYLFANDRYGKPFVEAARASAAKVVVVRSSRGVRPPGRPKAFLRSLRLLDRTELHVTDVNEQAFIRRIRAGDHGIIAGFNQIFREHALGRFTSLVNFHPSLLPFYRGPVPSYWCLAEGEQATGLTLHHVTAQIDAGPTLYQVVVPIEPDMTEAAVDDAIARAAVPVLHLWLDHLVSGTAWEPRTVDAAAVYRHHIGYRSFPKR